MAGWRSLMLMMASGLVVHLSCALLVGHRVGTMPRALRRPISSLPLRSTKQSGDNGHAATAASFDMQKSPESNFWVAISHENNTSTSSGSIPAVHGLDKETGPLPPGAYQVDAGVTAPCLIAVGIRPPSNANEGTEVWREGAKNCQKLIDAGFNTFRVNNCHVENEGTGVNREKRRRRSPTQLQIALEQMQQRTLRIETRHQAETNFYRALRQSTPPSVLRSCHFTVNLEIPSALSEDSIIPMVDEERLPVPFGNGWMVRESISDALLRTKGECLDSVVLDYRKQSPYHLDVLNTLFEMKEEGLVHSIRTHNFPPSLLRSALSAGFDIDANEFHGNLMNVRNIQTNGEMGMLCEDRGCSHHISAPLGGGLFTQQYGQFRVYDRLPASSKNAFSDLLVSCCEFQPGENLDNVQKWNRYRTIMDTLEDISFKYQVSVESIALRWLLQLNDGSSISVGTQLGMDFEEEQGGQPYSRQRHLRQVFTFHLEEDDMERLCQVSSFASDRSQSDTEHEIDFNNRALWM